MWGVAGHTGVRTATPGRRRTIRSSAVAVRPDSSKPRRRWAPTEPRENQEVRPDMSPAVCSHLDTIEFTAIPDPVVGCEGTLEDRLALGASADVNGLRQGRLLRRLAQPAPVEARALGLASQHQVGRALLDRAVRGGDRRLPPRSRGPRGSPTILSSPWPGPPFPDRHNGGRQTGDLTRVSHGLEQARPGATLQVTSSSPTPGAGASCQQQ